MKNNKGYTIMEAVVAMMLVAIVVTGVFSALMASRRAIVEPSYKEEMYYAVETASNLLKSYNTANPSSINAEVGDRLCRTQGNSTPLSNGTHTINCLLPDICSDDANSSFTYTVSDQAIADPNSYPLLTGQTNNVKNVTFSIVCNRGTL